MGAGARAQGGCRNLPAVHRADRRRPARAEHGFRGREIRLLAAATRCRQPGRDLAGAARWHLRPVLLGPLPVPLSGSGRHRQEQSRRPHLVPLGAERHPGRGNPPADPVFRRRVQGPHQHAALRGADLDEPRAAVWSLPAQGQHRRRRGCRPDAVGREPDPQHPADRPEPRLRLPPYEGLEVTGWPVRTLAPSRWRVPRLASLPAPTCPAGPARRSKDRTHACRPGRCAMREWRSTALRPRSDAWPREPGPLGPRCGPAYSHPHGS